MSTIAYERFRRWTRGTSSGSIRSGVAALVTASLCSAPVRAQNPVVAFPNNYKLVLNNPEVTVLRVHYGPHEKVGVHDHSDYTTVYVYLNDSGPVRFVHEAPGTYVLNRPSTHAGAFRVSLGMVERHSVENLSDTPSDYLRVELKKMPVHTLKQEFRGSEPAQPLLTATSTVYDNPALRVERVICDPGATCPLSPEPAPSVLIAISPTALVGESKGEMLTFEQPSSWLPAGAHEGVRSMGPAPAQVLRIVLLTR